MDLTLQVEEVVVGGSFPVGEVGIINNNFYYYSNARSIPFYYFYSKLGPLNLLYYLFIKKNQ